MEGKLRNKTKYLYHITDIKNITNISIFGILRHKAKNNKEFSPLSPELYRSSSKIIYFLPKLNNKGTKVFLKEWWHGNIEDILFLRINSYDLDVYQSFDEDYAKSEVWCYTDVKPNLIEYRTKKNNKFKWNKIENYLILP